ncbi:MAG: ATP-binding protein [Actinomycetota bacterium]|nr:ATP-binding protein [Actinomycetota bacterium]
MAQTETCGDAVEQQHRDHMLAEACDTIETPVLVVSVQGGDCRCVAANRAFAQRYLDGGQVEGKRPAEALPPTTAALLEAAAVRAVDTGNPSTYIDVADLDSPSEMTVTPLPGTGGLVAWTAVERPLAAGPGHDAAFDRQAHDMEEANAELSRSNTDLAEFAYVASHDLTEPLRMVASHLDFLRARCGDRLDEQSMRSLAFAVEGAERMRALVDALLELAQVTTQPVMRARVPLAEVVDDVLADLDSVVRGADARISVGELPVVRGDRKTLTSLMGNLVANAVKFRSEARPEVRIEAEHTGQGWCVRVRDNGVGIRAEHRAQIFEMFRRLQPRSKYAGTGIGLAICRRVVERHGGQIAVEPNPEGGSVFAFTLPDTEELS